MKAKQLHNYPFPIMLLALTAANALVHLEQLGWTSGTASLGLHFAAYVVVMMIVVMGGRVIPSFSDNKLLTRARRWALVEQLVPVATLGALPAALIVPDSLVTALLAPSQPRCMASALPAGTRTSSGRCRYAWIALGFALLALSAAGFGAAAGSALHAFTAGGIGVLTLGMMARVSLGHTGRMLEPVPLMALAFVAVNFAALIRVGAPLFFPKRLYGRHGRCRAGVDGRVRPVRCDLHPHPAAPAGRRQAGLTPGPRAAVSSGDSGALRTRL